MLRVLRVKYCRSESEKQREYTGTFILSTVVHTKNAYCIGDWTQMTVALLLIAFVRSIC